MENIKKYPNLKGAIFLVLYYEFIALVPSLIFELIRQIFKIPKNNQIISMLTVITTFILTLIWLKRKNRLNISKDMFLLKKFSVSRFIIIAITTVGMLLCIVRINEIVLNIFPVPKFIEELFSSQLLGGTSETLIFVRIVIVAPIIEEVIFRGIILRGFLSNYSGRKAIFLSALIFAIIHFNIWQFPTAFCVGTFAGWIFSKTRSISTCILIHSLYNGSSFLISFVSNNSSVFDNIRGTSYPELIGLVISVLGILWLKRSYKSSQIKDVEASI